MKKLFSPLNRLYRWVIGSPPKNPPSKIKKWSFRLLTIAGLGLMGWFLFLGPGVVLMPFAPSGYKSVADATNTVYYEKDDEGAREVLRLAREAQEAILEFWGGSNGIDLFDGTKIYMGETPEAYYRLTGNHAGGSAMLGSVIVINMAKVGEVLSLVDYMRHELGHSYLRRRFGYLRKHLTIPMWFDEGSAVVIQGESPDMASLGERLTARPRLLSVTELRYQTDWETMVFMEGSRLARQHYGYVGAFVEYLKARFGIQKIREYLLSLSWGKDPEEVFAAVYGIRLAEAERQFLSEYKEQKEIPEEITLIAPPIVPRVVIRWTLIFGFLAFIVLWATRQVFRILRFAATKIGSSKGS